MGRGANLGEFEELVLLAAARLGGDGHGAGIHEEILREADRDVSIPAVYVTLSRLEGKGYVQAGVAAPTEGRGGRPRKIFAVTPAGVRELQEVRLRRHRMWQGLPFDPVPETK